MTRLGIDEQQIRTTRCSAPGPCQWTQARRRLYVHTSPMLAGITAEPPSSLPSPPESDPSRTRAPSLGLLQNRLRRFSIRSSRSSRSDSSIQTLSAADIKGALGLNLLHEPSEPAIDFVFIHGLGGGSRKTWSHSAEAGMFWPKDWLPNEVGFKHVRIHSYGYNSDWTTRKDSRLTVHDFGQALLADLYNSPCLRKNGNTPIVFVAHSMGGLVAKKTYLIATRDPTYEAIGQRIHTMFFLGTPHRGADSANFARLVRQSAGYGPKAFLDDLIPGSGTLQQINDEFRHVCHKLNLWSFSESLPMSFGPTSSLVVEKQSAILGMPKEHVQYIEADHRQICKFDTPVNPNYLILQRAFLTTIEEMGASKKQHYGSCTWLTEDETFEEWVDGPEVTWDGTSPLSDTPKELTPKILWLNGRPGTGKTVAAGHVIRYLQSCNLDCSFYFFKHEDKTPSTLAFLLRSLAFQMADANFEVRRALVAMAEDDITIKHDDHHMLWTSLFVERIFKVEHPRPQFWVIDAIDECSSKGLPALVSMLSSMDQRFPARIMITSRPGGQVGRYLTLERTEFVEIFTGEEGSLKDIELFLNARFLHTGDAEQFRGMQNLVADVLAKSDGSFLWASLTIANLENAYSIEDKQDILRQIPPEMDKLYSRMLVVISASPSAELAKCVLKWTICSPKPLHIRELAEAVKLDIGKTLTANGRELENMTGHLVVVDSQSYIRIAHQTTSAFLSQQREDGFWIDRVASHSIIAEICLNLLCSADFAPPRTRRANATAKINPTSPLSEYAALNFSYHLIQGSSATDSLLILLNKFFRTNVLTWIERTAIAGNLWTLPLTAQRLKTYLGRRAKYQSPVSVESQTIATWANDIYHILAAFHSILLASPSSIHFLVPHFCPPKSMIGQLFAKPSRRLRISGPIDEDWNDRLTGYLFPEDACAIACSPRLLAVGLSSGDIKLYNLSGSGTFDAAATLEHGKRVRHLSFNRSSSLLASCSARKLQLWETRGSQGTIQLSPIWSKNIDFTPESISFDPEEQSIILANPQGSFLAFYGIKDGERAENILLHAPPDSDSSDESDKQVASWTPAVQIRLDSDHKLAALAYRNASVSIWDLTATESLGNFEKEGFEHVYATPQTLDMVFNPIAELELLAVSYKDGDVVTCNPWTQEQTNKYHLPTSLSVLSATSDGRILAGAAEDGGIYLFLFETLQPIYQIERPDDQLRIYDIVFSTDNLRFFDIRGQSCNVWEPFILVPKDGSDDSSSEPFSEEIPLPEATASHAHVFQWGEAITAIEPADDRFLLIGRQDGTIDVSELNTGDVVEKLRVHDAFTEIKSLDWNVDNSTLLSVDTTGRHILTKIASLGRASRARTTCLLDRRSDGNISQVILSSSAESLLVCTDADTKLINFNGIVMGEERNLNRAWWVKHPSSPSHLLAFQESHLHVYEWSTLRRVGTEISISSLIPQSLLPKVHHAWISGTGSAYLAQGLPHSPEQASGIVAVEASKITSTTDLITSQSLRMTSAPIQCVIGCIRSSLFFLDTAGWVCSVSLRHLAEASHFTRHFFIPLTWRTGTDVVIKVVSKTAVAFGRGEQLIIFHGFLEFEERTFELCRYSAAYSSTNRHSSHHLTFSNCANHFTTL
ncbi:hypothetical protein HER10_EVM0001257 [Colletotrichum scovillei]|uniref:uncharacterized protein n=1 Tax=Colletotrichum scovillei TaxID=1209932 RepID=UPI0015C316CF|nr:uncharacterized protein HER10_EVM0001257 [Colletotrichum scovillei]KAF4772853.1 hypothetical protein HER10_EVM0001257 [Colletotrichum scovillei]